MALKISAAPAIAQCDALVDLIDVGTGSGNVKVYDGTRPANPSVAVSTQTLLVDFDLPDPAFGAATATSGGAIATANAITAVAAAASGTASWFRVVDANGLAIFDGDVSDNAGSGDMKLSSTSIVSAVDVLITSFTVTQPKGW